MKLIFIFVLIAIVGCNDDSSPRDMKNNNILVSGQSNAYRCDWSYFEDKTGYVVTNISMGGTGIQGLIDGIPSDIGNFDLMVFVHGERDSLKRTDPDLYVNKLSEYQNILGVSEIYISSVGYTTDKRRDLDFDKLRDRVEDEAYYRDDWVIGYRKAKSFRERGMLIDHIHFSEAGCIEMMDYLSESIID